MGCVGARWSLTRGDPLTGEGVSTKPSLLCQLPLETADRFDALMTLNFIRRMISNMELAWVILWSTSPCIFLHKRGTYIRRITNPGMGSVPTISSDI